MSDVRRRWWKAAAALGVAGGALAASLALTIPGETSSRVEATGVCDRFASPSGRDSWSGTRKRPFATIPRLAASLRPGQVGCLLPGTYEQDQIIVRRGGKPGAPIQIRSAPGTRATVRGRLTIAANVSDLIISGLNLDGRNDINGASPTVLGDRIVFRNNEITNFHSEICFILGSTTRGNVAEGVVIDGNRIHDCGRLPPTNQDHGIYVQLARDTVIRNNYIYDNSDRGIQLYPDADGTIIENNVIDGNGEGIIFSGDGDLTSDNNIVRENIITNSRTRANVEYFYADGSPAGTGNVVEHNCISGGAEGDIEGDGIAFTAQGNVIVDPLYVDQENRDYTLREDSPCRWAAPKRTPPPAVLVD